MLIESVDETHAIHPRTRRFQFLPLFAACVFALTMYPTKTNAQIVGDMEADIPFQFHVGTPNFRRASTSFTYSMTPI
jgi:hypothetical protein